MTKNRVKIAPSILSADFADLGSELERLKNAKADIIHLDIMDGHYVPNLTFGLPIVKRLREITDIPLDVHLMVTNPEEYIKPLAEVGVDYISYHPETVYHNHRLIHQIREYKVKAGWAINPAVSVDIVEPVLDVLDFVLLMSVNPGFSGQSYIPATGIKIERLKEMMNKSERNSKRIEIEVDGGVNREVARKLIRVGANILVSGAFIFSNKDYGEVIRSLRNAE
jgi:ribulose-phosphate 3-epimerase